MRVLKVVAGTSTGSTVFELGRKAKSYDWDKAELLTDCLSQVFFGTGSFWSGNIEVYFELKGKLFCAGKRMQAGKSENYLAGEDDGNLTVYAEDYEGVLKYLGDFVGGDFLRYLQTVFVTAKDVGDFVSDNGRAILGDLVYAAKEAESDFDEKKFRELEEERARLEDIADASRLFARSAALKGVLDEKKKKAEELFPPPFGAAEKDAADAGRDPRRLCGGHCHHLEKLLGRAGHNRHGTGIFHRGGAEAPAVGQAQRGRLSVLRRLSV